MSLENFKNRFLSHCKTENITCQDSILEAIRNSYQISHSKHYVLVLSEKSLNNDICQILSECLRHDNTFEEIVLNDCMLSSDCLQLILEGLCDNAFCTKLSLKGNNIKNHGCELVARLIRQNNSITNLSLEWNQMGISGTGFDQFCDSLANNKSLQVLDLRNNQIGFDNCQIFAEALKKNDRLVELDLRYNSLGVSGGKELLNIFDKNRTLCKLLVLGNSIPLDIVKHMENLASRNGDNQKATERSHIKSNKSQRSSLNHDTARKDKALELLDRIDQQDNGFRMSDKKNFSKIIQLEKLLDDRKQKCHQLSANLTLAESKLEMYETQFKDMEMHFQKSLKEREYLERQYNLQVDKEKDFRIEMEKRFLKEQSQLQERILQLQSKVGELEINLKQQNDNVFELKEKISSINSDWKLKQLEYEECIAKMKDHHKKEINEISEKKEKELYKMKQEYNSHEEIWREKLSKLDKSGEELNQEISQLRSQMASDKRVHEENIHQVKQKLRNEEEQKSNKLEEQLRTIHILKEEIESQNARQAREIENLQKDNSKLKIEAESMKIKKENLEEELSGKQSQMMSEIEKVRLEWMHRVQKLETERQSQADLFTKIENQDKHIQDMKNINREELHSRNTEIQSLKDRVKSLELELNRKLDDERTRACALQNAVLQYCQPTVQSTGLPKNH